MKQVILIRLAVICLGCLPGFADAAGLKIGYVNMAKVIKKSPQAENALKKLRAEFGPRDKKLVAKRNAIKVLEQNLIKNSQVMKPSERRLKEREIIQKKRELRRESQEFNEDYSLRRNEELASLQKVVKKAILEIAKRDRFDLIVHEGVTLYSSKRIDLTEKVLRKLGKK
ncbi:MAG TPA: OmpH family outer membrane protein [Acidiferrobacteraceae bacterium]|nr:OmpH family outer membrane protein [Acidiferrobacteraceae bacterium]HEX19953.1 OmpH family outer membrane protein [Acidiferrobacteraceae bacterium]